MQDWVDLVGRPPRSYEWAPATAKALGLENSYCRLWQREHPRWPSARCVAIHFGCWNDAIEAAGYRPAYSLPRARELVERVRAAQRLSRDGMSSTQIAELVGVTARTVKAYLRARPCRDCGDPVIKDFARCQPCAVRRAAAPPTFTREAALAAIRDWVSDRGEPPRRHQWSRSSPGRPSFTMLRPHFESWKDAMETALTTSPQPPGDD